MIDSFGQTNAQVLQSPVPAVAPTYTATLPIHDQRAIAHQPENRSLFFEPLFNHTDFYLPTAAGATGQGLHNDHRQAPPQGESLESEHSASTLDESTSTKPMNESSMRTHPNFRNHFNNLSLSNSIRANGYSRQIQDAQNATSLSQTGLQRHSTRYQTQAVLTTRLASSISELQTF